MSQRDLDDLRHTNLSLTDRLEAISRNSSSPSMGHTSLMNEIDMSDHEGKALHCTPLLFHYAKCTGSLIYFLYFFYKYDTPSPSSYIALWDLGQYFSFPSVHFCPFIASRPHSHPSLPEDLLELDEIECDDPVLFPTSDADTLNNVSLSYTVCFDKKFGESHCHHLIDLPLVYYPRSPLAFVSTFLSYLFSTPFIIFEFCFL